MIKNRECWCKGFSRSDLMRYFPADSHLWKKSLTWKRKMSRIMSGKTHSEATRKKLSLYRMGKSYEELYGENTAKRLKEKKRKFMKGYVPSHTGLTYEEFFGKSRADEIKRKLAEANFIRFADPHNHPNWQGGLSFVPYPCEFNRQLKDFVRKIYGRKCALCHLPENDRKLAVHHIDFNKERISLDNLVPLHLSCHAKLEWHIRRGGMLKENSMLKRKAGVMMLKYGGVEACERRP